MLQDFRYSIRLLRRTPGFTTVAILVLALGIGVNTAVLSVVDVLVLQPRPGRIDSLVGLFNRDRTNESDYRGFSYPAYVSLRDEAGVFDSLMAQSFTTVGVRDGDLTRQTFAAVVSSNYFATLGVSLAAGRTFTPQEERGIGGVPVAIASYTTWKRAGLDPAFIGSTLRINGTAFTVIGVTPRGFGGAMAFVSPQLWLPLGTYDSIVNPMFKDRATGLADRENNALVLAGALERDMTAAAAGQALDAFSKRVGEAFPRSDRDRLYVLGSVPRMAVSTRPQTDGPLSALSALLALMALLVLAVACLNLANLLLARGAARGREISVRLALGSGRGRIIRQLIVEGLTLSIIGAAVGLLAGWWTTTLLSAWLNSIVTFGIDFVAEPSSRLFVAAAVFALVSTLFFALGPAWSLSRPDAALDLKAADSRTARRLRIGPVLVAGQLAVTLALVTAGGLFARGAVNAARLDGGFPLAQQLVVGVDPSLAGYGETRTRATYAAVLDRVRRTPGIASASFASTAAFGDIQMGATARLAPTDQGVGADYDIVGGEYFATLRLPILRGRDFTRAEEQPLSSGAQPAVVDVLLAKRLFGEADPIGRTISLQARATAPLDSYVVVGVCASSRHDLFDDPPRPHVYVPYGSKFNTMMTVHARVAAGAPEAAMIATLRRELQQVDAQLPILFARTLTMQRDASISQWSVRAAASMFTTFGVLALLLAAIGVYGLKAYDVSRRTREIGIRMALGASGSDVTRLIVRDGAVGVAVGLGVGLLLAVGVGKLASGFLFRVSALDPLVLAIAAATLSAASILASYLPARRATRVAPTVALRAE